MFSLRRLIYSRIVIVVTASMLVMTGCATEVIELNAPAATAEGEVAQDPNPEISANATLDELRVILSSEFAALSAAVFDSNRDLARIHLQRINTAWGFMEPLIAAKFGELAEQINYDLRRVVDLARSAVERNRPADADKAILFLRLALASLDA